QHAPLLPRTDFRDCTQMFGVHGPVRFYSAARNPCARWRAAITQRCRGTKLSHLPDPCFWIGRFGDFDQNLGCTRNISVSVVGLIEKLSAIFCEIRASLQKVRFSASRPDVWIRCVHSRTKESSR